MSGSLREAGEMAADRAEQKAADRGESLARASAQSVFRYIDRSARRGPRGVRWRTGGSPRRPRYGTSIYDGAAGISLFLTDYHRLTGSRKALDLALGSLRLCSSRRGGYSRGLYVGGTGVAMAWLHLSRVTGDTDLLARCASGAESELREAQGPVTDLLGGAAGNGLFLVRLWEVTREARYLAGAVRNAEWLDSRMVRNAFGAHVPMRFPGERIDRRYNGFAHGSAGIAYFALVLFEATRDERWADFGRTLIATLVEHAVRDRGGLNWGRVLGERAPLRCQWCHGSPGVGLLFAKAWEILGDPGLLDISRAAGETTWAYGDVRRNPSQCHGLAGNGELFLELHRLTGEPLWLERARSFARRSLAHRRSGPRGDRWRA